jgi:hypothetical protein
MALNLDAVAGGSAAETPRTEPASAQAPAQPPAQAKVQPTAQSDAQSGAQASAQAEAPAPAQALTETSPVRRVSAVWAGWVDGGGATVAIVARDGAAVAYLCSGGQIRSVLKGDASNGELALTGKRGANLVGEFGNGRATGTVTALGRYWTFDIAKAKKSSATARRYS